VLFIACSHGLSDIEQHRENIIYTIDMVLVQHRVWSLTTAVFHVK